MGSRGYGRDVPLSGSGTAPRLEAKRFPCSRIQPLLWNGQPGDSVTFLPVEKGHNSASIKGMIPDGAAKWKGKINKEITVTFDKLGYYGYMCTPHYALGMVGMVIVEGEAKLANLDAAKAVKHRGKAKKEWEEIWAQAEAEGLLS